MPSQNISRRGFVSGAALSLSGRAAQLRPNVLFLMADEMHHRSLSLTGNPYMQTPNMDRIGREGAVFTNATCVTPFCSPSRATMITGVYPHRHGIVQNVPASDPVWDTSGNLSGEPVASPRPHKGGRAQPPLAPDAFPTTEMALHASGFATAFRGKWHLGNIGEFPCYESFYYASKVWKGYPDFLEQRLPASRFSGNREPGRYLGRPVKKIPAIRAAWDPFQQVGSAGYIATIGRTVIPADLLPETQITTQVLGLLERFRDRSFMITASWSPPHDLWVIPDPYYSLVGREKIRLAGSTDLEPWDAKGPSRRLGKLAGEEGIREYAAIYQGMVRYIDDQVGRILEKLDELGLAGNTLVVLTSDHGDMVGAHGCIGKSVFSFFDDLVKIPLCMRLPGRIRAGTVVRNPVSQIDYMPTILDYAGLPAPGEIHGKTLRPLLEGRRVEWRDYAFCQRGPGARMIRTGRYKYVYSDSPRVVALYDLWQDPDEDRNLAHSPARAAELRTMHNRLIEVMARDGDPLVRHFPKEPI